MISDGSPAPVAVAQLLDVRPHERIPFMKTLFTAPVWWSEKAVGTWSRFLVMILAQVGSFVFVCWLDHWRGVGIYVFFGLVMPLCYLIALRGMLRELRKRSGAKEKPVA